MQESFPLDPESLLSALTKVFIGESAPREVALLSRAKAAIKFTYYDNYDGGTYYYALQLEVPTPIYGQIVNDRQDCEQEILQRAELLLRSYRNYYITSVYISPSLDAEKGWRERAQAWVAGSGISNQGRVRSDNIATRTCDGLLFRSQQEIHLYKALKYLGVSFAPLPVFIHGGPTYRRIEPDFVIIKDGIVMIVEVDGDTVHLESPAEAHDRITMLVHEGAYVERVKAHECNTEDLALNCAKRLLQIIEKLKASR